jgi:N-acetylneuraminic acid mutarotase
LNHAATVLPGGQVLVTGGRDDAPNPIVCASELYEPATGLWSRTGALNLGRDGHTATLLSNGDVLVTGGHTEGTTFTDKAEVYDSSAKNWDATAELSFSRAGHVGVSLANGRVLVAGGFSGSSDFAPNSEIYDPVAASWEVSGGMQISRQTAIAVLLGNGKVLAAGGFGNGNFLSSAELFDPAAGQWTFTGSMHDLRWGAAAVLLSDGKVLVAGGDANLSSFQSAVRTAELYDPAAGNWTPTGSMNQERHSFTLTLLPNGNVLAAGGNGTNGAVASAEVYNANTRVWTPTGSLQTPRTSHTATLLPKGKVLVAGGANLVLDQTGADPVDPTVASAELYDPATGVWTPTGSMGQPRQVHTAKLLPGGKVLIAGGVSYFGGLFPTSAELYDPTTGTWLPTLPLVSGRRDHITALLPNGKVLLAGGFNTSDTGPSAELFDPASAVATAFQLEMPRKSSTGAVQFTFRNIPGLRFTVLSTTTVETPVTHWTGIGLASEISPGHYQFTESAPDTLRLFYAVRSE